MKKCLQPFTSESFVFLFGTEKYKVLVGTNWECRTLFWKYNNINKHGNGTEDGHKQDTQAGSAV